MEFLFLVFLILQIIILIFSIVIHEVSHGAMADYLGDPTAKYAGRLTLNPSKHLDLIGSVIVPLFLILTTGRGFGWAKPVPINPYNFRDQKYGSLKVALAGPGVNLAVALVFGLILRFSLAFISSSLASIFSSIIYLNIILGVFNLLPIPPLDGSHVLFTFLPYSMQKIKIFLTQFGFFILIFLIFFFPWFFQFLIYIVNWIFTIIVGAPLF
ncbi:MAG: site-2 protease family protein [Candidatus Nealsonbacteria bacterium]